MEVKVKVICGQETDDIISQYIRFSKIYDEQRILHGRTRKAIAETIRICKDRNVLCEYLKNREKEVVTIMMSLFDEDAIMRTYIKSERMDAEKIGEERGEKKNALTNAKRLIQLGTVSLEDIASVTQLSLEEIQQLKEELTQEE